MEDVYIWILVGDLFNLLIESLPAPEVPAEAEVPAEVPNETTTEKEQDK